jgi:hypothetical protein
VEGIAGRAAAQVPHKSVLRHPSIGAIGIGAERHISYQTDLQTRLPCLTRHRLQLAISEILKIFEKHDAIRSFADNAVKSWSVRRAIGKWPAMPRNGPAGRVAMQLVKS